MSLIELSQGLTFHVTSHIDRLFRVKANNSNLKVDLYINGELLDQADDRKLISQLAIRDKTVSVYAVLRGWWRNGNLLCPVPFVVLSALTGDRYKWGYL